MITTIILLSFGTLFAAYEFIAHFVFGNVKLQTLSFVIRSFEKLHPWAKAGVSLVLITLWLHLVLQLF